MLKNTFNQSLKISSIWACISGVTSCYQNLEFSGLLEKTLKVFAGFGLKVVFVVAIASKKQKQIDDESADRGDPSSTFQSLCSKFSPLSVYFNWLKTEDLLQPSS